MFDDGAHSEGVARDGVFGAILSPRTNGTILEFYIQATDNGGATRPRPAAALDRVFFQAAHAHPQVANLANTPGPPNPCPLMTHAHRPTLQATTANNPKSHAHM